MKVVLTGGGTGGHFYPLMAVAEQLRMLYPDRNDLELHYLGDAVHDPDAMQELNVTFSKVQSGKLRIYPSLKTVLDMFKLAFSLPLAFFKMLSLYPDVVFSKGGHVAVPVLWASRVLRIPVIIHESDTVPGRTNVWTGSFAERIALSFPSAQDEFIRKIPKLSEHPEKFQVTGLPMRQAIFAHKDSSSFFTFPDELPTLLVLGGSQGAVTVNNAVLSALSILLLKYNIIHQTGKANYNSVVETSKAIIDPLRDSARYLPVAFLNQIQLSEALQKADIVVTRAGSGIFEIARAGKPSIIIPISESHGDHQRMNAYTFERFGAAKVIEESNLTPSILVSSLSSIIDDQATYQSMSENAQSASPSNAGALIAQEIVRIAQSH